MGFNLQWPVTASGRIWWTDIDYFRSRTTSILKNINNWSHHSDVLANILPVSQLLKSTEFSQYFDRALEASFAASYISTLICSLKPSALILTGDLHRYTDNSCFFLFSLRLIIFIFVLSTLVLSGIAIQVSKCDVFKVAFHGDCLNAFLQSLTLLFPGLVCHSADIRFISPVQ